MVKSKSNLKIIVTVIMSVIMIFISLPVSAASDEPLGDLDYNEVPVPDYVYEYIIDTRQVDLKGSQNNFTDERFFDYPTYSFGFRNMMLDPIDITAAKYIEFDFYSDKAGTVWMSLGSAHMQFEFYDNRSLHKSFTVSAGWNHIVLTTDGEYREPDSTTFKTYNPEMVTGFILHSVDAGYVRLTNVALTSDEVSQGNNDVPVPDYVYEDIVATRQVDLKGTQNNFTDERFFDFPTYANGFYDMMTNPLDITAAEYIEFDFYSDKAGIVWMSLGSAHMHFEFYDNRSLHKSFTVNEGWNHIVLTTDGEYREFDSTTLKTYNPEMVTGFILHSVDAGYVRLTNVALTSDEVSQGNNDAPVPDYVYEDIVATRQVDLKGSQNNFTDERFFDFPTYANGFNDMMLNPLDITAAKYIEFDFYSDKAGTVWMSLGSAHMQFEFYDNRSLHKSFTVNAGWNHIVLTTDGEYREADSTTFETYNPEMVTGFILHSVDADYVRLTNVALTYSVSQGDTVLNYRSDFDLGAVMHAPQWSSSYSEENLELQIKQLKEMGGSLLRVDAVDNFPHLDKTVKLCNAYGIKVMLIVYIPGRTFDPTVPVDLDAVREYYRMYATRYDGKHGCGKIDYIQIDNELDVAFIGWTGSATHGQNISDYAVNGNYDSIAHLTEQVRAASLGIADANTDIKRILNIAWIHYGILKYFQQEGVEWDVTGHDWYQDMFDYGDNPNDCYNSGQELYDLFKKPIIICETNMWMFDYYSFDGSTPEPPYQESSWWSPLVEVIEDFYEKDFVIGCTVYEFYDEPNNFGGGGHFGINEVNADGSFKSHKPIYFILQQMFEGETVEQENWQEVEREYSVREDTDMRSLIAIKNALLEDNGIYKSEYDLEIDGRVDSRDYTFLRKYLFENL